VRQCFTIALSKRVGPENPDRGIIGQIPCDTTAIEAREKPTKSDQSELPAQPKRKRVWDSTKILQVPHRTLLSFNF
jgi:hypothetical protein